jgi:hypothetical protein
MKSISYIRKRCTLTLNHTYDLPPRVGRKKEFPNRITLPLSDEMLAGIDAARVDEEDRLTLIRSAIERELKRRERSASGRLDGSRNNRNAADKVS